MSACTHPAEHCPCVVQIVATLLNIDCPLGHCGVPIQQMPLKAPLVLDAGRQLLPCGHVCTPTWHPTGEEDPEKTKSTLKRKKQRTLIEHWRQSTRARCTNSTTSIACIQTCRCALPSIRIAAASVEVHCAALTGC